MAFCESAVAALQAARDLVPDVVLADVHEGVALRGRLPASWTGRSIPIVDLTGHAADALLSHIWLALGRRA
jgi:CheY-like chemotaxis protein